MFGVKPPFVTYFNPYFRVDDGYSLLSGEGRVGLTDREMEKQVRSLVEKIQVVAAGWREDQNDENVIRISGDLS